TKPRRGCPSGQRGAGLEACFASGAGGAADNFLPVAKVSCLPPIALLLSLAADPSTVTESPTLTESLVQPSLLSSTRLGSSTCQFVASPFTAVTSTKTSTCGLVQSNLVTTPLRVTGFLSS